MFWEIVMCLLVLVFIAGILDLIFWNGCGEDLILSNFIKIDEVYYMAKGDMFSPEFDFDKDVFFVIPRKLVRGKDGKGVYVVFDMKTGTDSSEYERADFTIKVYNFVTNFKRFK